MEPLPRQGVLQGPDQEGLGHARDLRRHQLAELPERHEELHFCSHFEAVTKVRGHPVSQERRQRERKRGQFR